MEIETRIKEIAGNLFEKNHLDQFYKKYLEMSDGFVVTHSLINLSTDQGNELEISFFTKKHICDITLSNGVVYSYQYELSKISSISLNESEDKWTLNIYGEKRFDYNVVKPGLPNELIRYQKSLEQR